MADLAPLLPLLNSNMTDSESPSNLPPSQEAPNSPAPSSFFSSQRLWLKKLWNPKNLYKKLEKFDPQAFLSWASTTVQKRGIAFYGTLVTVVASTYFVSDLTALILAESIPDPPPKKTTRNLSGGLQNKGLLDYSTVFSRNLFNSQGLIPGEDQAPRDLGGAPVKSTLPLSLIGTLIMTNERRSIGTIEDKSTSLIHPVRVEDEIPGKIVVTQIEVKKVIFINKSSGKKEFIELAGEAAPQNVRLTPGKPGPTVGSSIEKLSATQFNISRSEVDRALADFNNILTQARAVPNFENGMPSGYKLFQIVPGSIYDKLGLQNGDIISGLNGQPINDPGKAFEMLSELKTANHLELQVKKDGKQSNYTYDIR